MIKLKTRKTKTVDIQWRLHPATAKDIGRGYFMPLSLRITAQSLRHHNVNIRTHDQNISNIIEKCNSI